MFLEDEFYAEILEFVEGQSLGLIENRYGNHGDKMIERATLELFERNKIPCNLLTERDLQCGKLPSEITVLVEPGGGNIGGCFRGSPHRRRIMSQIKVPKIILPQTASDLDEDLSSFDTIFAREEVTWKMMRAIHSDVRLAPDMALSLQLPESIPRLDIGEHYRNDEERIYESYSDPVRIANNINEYLKLAGSYRCVVTNRLHFGIAALLQGQSCVLCPNSYHKNRSMFQTWLRKFPKAEWRGFPSCE